MIIILIFKLQVARSNLGTKRQSRVLNLVVALEQVWQVSD